MLVGHADLVNKKCKEEVCSILCHKFVFICCGNVCNWIILQIFNKSLLAKFAWAMDVDPDFRF